MGNDFGVLEKLLQIEQRQRLVWESMADLPVGYLDGVESLESLVQSPRNILQSAEHKLKVCNVTNWFI